MKNQNKLLIPEMFSSFRDASNIIWVPYYQNPTTLELTPVFPFEPIAQSIKLKEEPPKSNCGARILQWTEQEDEILYNSMVKNGVKSWAQIANLINKQVYNGEEMRHGKHCRERWFNHVNPEIKSNFNLETEWTKEEDLELVKLFIKHGKCWSLISKHLTGRTENFVKNRFNSLCRKAKRANKSLFEFFDVSFCDE